MNYLELLENRWVLLALIIFAGFAVKVLVNFILSKIIKTKLKASFSEINKTVKPIGVVVGLLVIEKLLYLFKLTGDSRDFWSRAIYIAIAIVSIWLGVALVNLLTLFLAKWAKRTITKSDDILTPLISKTLKVLVVIVGIIFIAYSFKIDVKNLIAGLGIGAMAFAFAAKDTLANFFGSIMIILDRPFDIGDYINVGGIDGTVEEVGFRSTRLRTIQDSIVSIPNGKLANENVDNFGRRRFRRYDIVLGIEYETSADGVKRFCERVEGVLESKEWVVKDKYLVHFDSLGDFSLNIKVKYFADTLAFDKGAIYKDELLRDFLNISQELGVGFAFPTQTIHLNKG